MKRRFAVCVLLAIGSSLSGEALATSYEFTVTCQQKQQVVEWKTGSIDPGKEYLRVATGVNNPNCSITDYNSATDSKLPRQTLSHEGGLLAGIPFVGMLVCQWFKKC